MNVIKIAKKYIHHLVKFLKSIFYTQNTQIIKIKESPTSWLSEAFLSKEVRKRKWEAAVKKMEAMVSLIYVKKEAVQKIEAWIKPVLAKRKLIRRTKAATKAQAQIRGFLVRKKYKEIQSATIAIQKKWRAWLAKNEQAQSLGITSDSIHTSFIGVSQGVRKDPSIIMRENAVLLLHDVNPLRAAMYQLFLPDNHHQKTSFLTHLGHKGFFACAAENKKLATLQCKGIFIALFKRGNQIFVVCRGTDPSFNDKSASLNLDPIQPAFAAIEENKILIQEQLDTATWGCQHVTLLGHSLGGAKAMHLSKIISASKPEQRFNIDLCLYNAAPFDHEKVLSEINNNLKKNSSIVMRIIDWRVSGDPINMVVKDSPVLISQASIVRFHAPHDLDNPHGKMPFAIKAGTDEFYEEAEDLPETLNTIDRHWSPYTKAATFLGDADSWYSCHAAQVVHATPDAIRDVAKKAALVVNSVKNAMTPNQKGLALATVGAACNPTTSALILLAIAGERVRREYFQNESHFERGAGQASP